MPVGAKPANVRIPNSIRCATDKQRRLTFASTSIDGSSCPPPPRALSTIIVSALFRALQQSQLRRRHESLKRPRRGANDRKWVYKTETETTRKSCTGRSPVRSIGHVRSCRRRVATWWKEQTRRSQIANISRNCERI